jgi:hypothetical protein
VFTQRFDLRILVLLGLVTAGACSSGDDSVTQPPATSTVTQTFTGVLTKNGARVHTFTVTAGGAITALLTTLAPNSAVGLSLGTWNGSICAVGPGLFNDDAIQGEVVVAQTSATGDFCVRIYDAAGTVVEPPTYVIDVSYQVSTQ